MKIKINSCEGINTSTASLQLKTGEVQNLQNVRNRPYYNWQKRNGIEYVSSQTDPVLGIFELDLDNITIPIIQSGSSLTFFPELTSAGGFFSTPDPYPMDNPIDSDNSNAVLFLVEPSMRAINDRRQVSGHTATSWPNRFFNADGTLINGLTGIAVSNFPANNIYRYDLAYYDAYFGNAFGSRASTLVNAVRTSCVSTVGFNDWINLIDGQSTVTTFTSSIFPSASTFANYRSTLANIKTGIRRLTLIKKQATQVNIESKDGTAQDTSVCPPYGGCYKIQGYSDGLFTGFAPSCCGSPITPNPWDGTFDLAFGASGPECFCTWANSSTNLTKTIQGYPIFTGSITGTTICLDYDGNQYLTVTCEFGDPIWTGSKSDGGPTGTYSDDGSCSSGPATVTVVAC